MKTAWLLIFCILFSGVYAQESERKKARRMEWFKDAKLGIFIHYGIYAVNGIDESWSFHNGYINYEDYMKQLDGFTASSFNADEWASLFKESGAKYAVLTTKHHDGVALWDTQTDHYNVVDHTPAGKDLVAPFVKAMRDNDLRVGLYYSLIDWSHPDYPGFTRTEKRYNNDPEKWKRFTGFYHQQMKELSQQFNPDLYWFDGDWEHSAEAWQSEKLRNMLFSHNPKVILNSRLQGYGDYATPEQGVPLTKPENPYWELCMTMNDSWGYQHNDHNYKTPYQMIRIFVDCISMGGNLLMDIGPKADGSIPEEQLAILNEFGRWTKKHSEAIYGTRAGLSQDHYNGPSALSKDNKTLYLYLPRNLHTAMHVTGLASEVKNVRLVGTQQSLDFKQTNNLLSIEVANAELDPMVSVIAVDLKSSVKTIQPGTTLFEAKVAPLLKDDNWKEKHRIAIADFNEGIPSGHYAGPTALSNKKDILYLCVDGEPNGPLVIRGLKNKINRIWVVGNGTKLSHDVKGKLYWSHVPGIVYIDIPKVSLDKKMTVIAVLLDGPVDLYREKGQVIESN
jgi:alpha-L-fucosidase